MRDYEYEMAQPGWIDRFITEQTISSYEDAIERWADKAQRPAIRKEFNIENLRQLKKLLWEEVHMSDDDYY